MSLPSFMKPKKTLEELEEEQQTNEAEISVLRQQVIKKELKKRDQELSSFKDDKGLVDWKRAWNWLKTHG